MAINHFFRRELQKLQLSKFRFSSLVPPSSNNYYSQLSGNDGKHSEEKLVRLDDGGRPPEPQQVQLETSEEAKKRLLQKCKIFIREPEKYHLISGVPLEVTCTRTARIHQTTKNAQQCGTRHLGQWLLDFETKERWENPLTGWCSSGDALSNVEMRFATKAEAIEYCTKNNMSYWVQERKMYRKFKVDSYALNFHYTRRTRVSTK